MLEKLADKKPLLVLAAILLLGLFLRTYCLTCESLWVDEGYSVNWAESGPLNVIYSVSNDVHPPLYYIVLSCWMSFAGDSELSLRLLSAIFSILSMIMVYKITLLLTDRRTGMLASLLFALSVFQIYFSQEVRGYSMLVLLTLVSMYFFLRLPEKRKSTTILYIISSMLMVYTHYFGLFVILSQNVYVLSKPFFRKKPMIPIRKWITLQVILLITFIPWITVMVYRLMTSVANGTSTSIGWIPLPSAYSLVETFFQYSGYYYLYPWGFGTQYFHYMSILSAILSVIVIILAVKSVIYVNRKRITITRKDRDQLYFLLLWMLIPIAVPFILSYLLSPIYWARYTIVASPAFYILASMGIRSINTKYVRYILIAVIVVLSLTNAYRFHSEVNKEEWRDAAAYIDSHGMPGDILLMYKEFTVNGPIEYYLNNDYEIIGFPPGGVQVGDQELDNLREMTSGNDRIWLILSHHIYSYDGTDESIKDTLRESHEMIDEHEFFAIELYLFEKK